MRSELPHTRGVHKFHWHHLDGDSENNSSSNVVPVLYTEHWELHFQSYLDGLRKRNHEAIRKNALACNGIRNACKTGDPTIRGFKNRRKKEWVNKMVATRNRNGSYVAPNRKKVVDLDTKRVFDSAAETDKYFGYYKGKVSAMLTGSRKNTSNLQYV